MQEYGEVSTHLGKAIFDHFFGRAAHHHPVGFVVRVTQKPVADSAAYTEDIHGLTLLPSLGSALAAAIAPPREESEAVC